MPFEVFNKRMTPLAKAPAVTIQKRGVISLNKAAHELINSSETVELLFDADRQVMALRPAEDTSPHAYGVRAGSNKGPGRPWSRPRHSPSTTESTPQQPGGGGPS